MSDIENAAPVIAIPAPVAPAASPAPESESTAEQTPAPEGESPEAKPERTFTQRELDEVVQKRLGKESRRIEKLAQAQARAEYAERERDALAALLNPPDAQSSGKPAPEQFRDYESYIDALTDWKVDQKVGGIRQENQAQQQQRLMTERATAIRPKVEAAQAKYDDFDDIAYSYDAPPAMQAAMLKSAHTGELYYYLGANPAERQRIAQLDDLDQAYAIRDLEKTLTAAPNPTRTPAPIVPNSSKSPVSKSLSDESFDGFVARREKFRKAQRKR